ncbi:MAG: ribokinase [Rhizobiaceae bacterium]|nr:ribokinase [Rhizobiaceae bacterium]
MCRVLVLGNAGLDLSLQVPRLPERGETLLGKDVSRAPGGKGLNQAVSAARAGAEVLFQAPVGWDAQGEEVSGALAAETSLAFLPQRSEHPTDFSLLMVLSDGENSIVSAGPCAAAFEQQEAIEFAEKVTQGDILVMQGNLTAAATREALAMALLRGATTILNPAPLWWDARPLLPFCSIVVVNRIEAETITGASVPTEAAAMLCEFGASIAIITLGAEGCLVHRGGSMQHFKASPVEAIDTTGCGDTFCGVLAAAIASGRALDDAVILAQKAAAITATRSGAFAALPSRAEISAIIEAGGGR